MKRYLTFIMVLVCAVVSAQNIQDVLRYSTENLQGTARFNGLSGAFGALGGDLSALNVNPAGSAVFKNSQFTFTGSNYNRNNDATYFNTTNNTQFNNAEINQVGGVFVFRSTDDSSNWRKVSLAFNYDLVQNFENRFLASGRSNQGIDNYFLNFAQGLPFGPLTLQDGEFIEDAYLDIGANLGFANQQAFLGYFGGIINPVEQTDANTAYISNAQYTDVNQTFLNRTSGYNSKFTANVASQYQDNLYIGASLNFHTIFFEKVSLFSEDGYDPASAIQAATFDNLLQTEGNGFSLSVGAIAKLNNNIRIGGSYQSPTWYRLTDNTSQRINSDAADDDIQFINFDIINRFESYTIKTPEKLTGSLAVIFGKEGLLSFDYSYQDMSNAELRPTGDPSFASQNNLISNELGAVSTYRVGGEIRFDQVSLRAGYRFEQSPYKNAVTIGDLTGYSAGIGYNFGGSRLDLAFSRSEQDVNQLLFDTGLTTPVFLNNINTNITLGYTMNF